MCVPFPETHWGKENEWGKGFGPSVAITKYFVTKYFTLNPFFEKSTRNKYFVNFGI